MPFPEHSPETAASSALSNLFTTRGGPKAQLTMRKEISASSGPTRVAPKSQGRCFSVRSFCLVPCPCSLCRQHQVVVEDPLAKGLALRRR